ncbi:hypothetical protein V7x_55040 [Crateriforma conspicua]|uniref:Uncharacterized protein n=1 Tax=Crateriforma conspicua TaxID=2527996 RepID=A0A5C6FIV9_9PLAN|nr:hypothetical protein V7x_55040 [Crateriforma conspicua]
METWNSDRESEIVFGPVGAGKSVSDLVPSDGTEPERKEPSTDRFFTDASRYMVVATLRMQTKLPPDDEHLQSLFDSLTRRE